MSEMLPNSEQGEKEEEKKVVDFKPFACTLLRTDARSALTQEIVPLYTQSKTPVDIYIVCGGSNGVLDFFLMQNEADTTAKPKIQFQRHEFVKLPSKCEYQVNTPFITIS